jgi:hypothetical protein
MTGPLSAASWQPDLGRGVVRPLLARRALNEEWRILSHRCAGIGRCSGRQLSRSAMTTVSPYVVG